MVQIECKPEHFADFRAAVRIAGGVYTPFLMFRIASDATIVTLPAETTYCKLLMPPLAGVSRNNIAAVLDVTGSNGSIQQAWSDFSITTQSTAEEARGKLVSVKVL